jgi:hypothetical protein
MAVNRAKYVYAPKVGDEIKWPNGVVMTYSDEGVITVTADDGKLWALDIEGEPGASNMRLWRRSQ